MARIVLVPKRKGGSVVFSLKQLRSFGLAPTLAFNMQVRNEHGVMEDEVDLYAESAGAVDLDALEDQIAAYRREAEGVPMLKVDYDFITSMLADDLLVGVALFDRLEDLAELLANLRRANGETLRRKLIVELAERQEQEKAKEVEA